ncbi:hypothetical protein MHH60_17110 [Paenibacillus sp. FSL H7-0716]|uniref:hypothetical protein n=1 Tax=Paenibacillus TaxID=44249 RepID=UPI0015C2FB9D|nr:hypothetical protein [Paenibacillus odorifer]
MGEVLKLYNFQNEGFATQFDYLTLIKTYMPSGDTPVKFPEVFENEMKMNRCLEDES